MDKELRTIDANINRVSEGLRVLEDIARFILNDEPLSKELKGIRHSLVKSVSELGIRLIDSRDVAGDWGSVSIEKTKREDLISVISANARRAQEGLRVIEELSKINPRLKPAAFKKARFAAYTLERELAGRVSRKGQASKLAGLYVVVDTGIIGKKDPAVLAAHAIAGGARIIQLRHKCCDKREMLDIAIKLQKVCRQQNVLFIINDHIDVALACNADGVHLGQSDLPVQVARKLMPIDRLIGCSASTISEVKQAVKDGADYIAVGSIFPTSSKDDIDVVGLERLRQIRENTVLPVVAIGGISSKNIADVIAAGSDSAAVISAVLSAPDAEKAAASLSSAFIKAKKKLPK